MLRQDRAAWLVAGTAAALAVFGLLSWLAAGGNRSYPEPAPSPQEAGQVALADPLGAQPASRPDALAPRTLQVGGAQRRPAAPEWAPSGGLEPSQAALALIATHEPRRRELERERLIVDLPTGAVPYDEEWLEALDLYDIEDDLEFAEAEFELAAAEETSRMAALMVEFEEEMRRRAREGHR